MDADTLAGYLKLAADARACAEQSLPFYAKPPIGYPGLVLVATKDIPALASAVEALVAEMRRLTEQRAAIRDLVAGAAEYLPHPDATTGGLDNCAAAKLLRDALALLDAMEGQS